MKPLIQNTFLLAIFMILLSIILNAVVDKPVAVDTSDNIFNKWRRIL